MLIVLAFFLYRLGYVDRYIANQIKRTFSNYGIRAEIREFHADIPPRTVTMSGVELYDAATGEKLGKIDQLDATIRIEDLYALNLQRNINLKDLKIHGFEAWVTFDEQGQSNFAFAFRHPNRTSAFSSLTRPRLSKKEWRHSLRRRASRDLRHGPKSRSNGQPDDPNAPAESG